MYLGHKSVLFLIFSFNYRTHELGFGNKGVVNIRCTLDGKVLAFLLTSSASKII